MSGITLMMLGNFALAGGVSPASLWGWGDNYNGSAARNSTEAGGRYSSPVQLGSDSDWLDIEGSYNFTATRESGYLYNCGDGRFGAWNTGLNASSPIQIGSLTNWVGGGAMLAQEATGAKAIKSDGTLWSWGSNDYGVMGINQSPSTGATDPYLRYSSPVQVGSLTTWAFTTGGGGGAAAAINNAGQLFTWGPAHYGNLGNNLSSGDISSPVQVGSLTTWSTGASGNAYHFFVKTDGTAWVWGFNDFGQLGVGNTTNYSSPVQLGSATDWTSPSCGYQNTAGIRSGKLYSWGRNSSGGVGDGTVVARNSPVQIGALTTWQEVQTGNQMAIALKTNGTLWAWGANYQGQAGQNNVIKYSSPVQIGSLTDWSRIHMPTSSGATCWALKA
jgi:alpha-tubulin suppressor-like RCC1 family protein